MCTPTATAGTMIPYGLKIPSPYFSFGPGNGGSGGGGGVTQGQLAALDFQRSQLHDYNVRVQLGLRNYQNSLGLSPFHAYITDPYAHAYFYKHDPRARFVQEEPKPSHSYIGLIGMAILHSKEKKLVLSDIYQWILDNYPYFRTRGPGWRNSIRHNLSLNDCFIKSGRSANGKGHYWAVHPANVEDFERGDFRRRRAQRKVRRHMGLSVPDDDDSPSPSPTQPWMHHDVMGPGSADKASSPTGKDHHGDLVDVGSIRDVAGHNQDAMRLLLPQHHPHHPMPMFGLTGLRVKKPSRKRLFDMASLLAPDEEDGDESSPEKIRALSSPQTTSSETGMSYSNNIINKHKSEDCENGEREHFGQNKDLRGEHENRGQILYDDDDTFCDDDDDEDNCEEIHVTSDDETPDRVNSDSKCLSDVESDSTGQNSGVKTIEENSNLNERRGVEVEKNEHDIDSQQDNRHSMPFPETNNLHENISEQHSSARLLNSTALLKQSPNNMVHNASTMKAIYDLMSDKLRDKDNTIFHSPDRQISTVIRSNDTTTISAVTGDHFKTPRTSILHDNIAFKDGKLLNPHNNPEHSSIPRQSQPLDHYPSSSLPENVSSSHRIEHRPLTSSSISGENTNNFSAFEALGIRGNPSSIFTTSHVHPGMLRAMAPFSGPPALLSQGPLPRPGIPTSCLQMLQASTAVPAPSLSSLNTLNTSSTVAGNNKR